MSRKRTRVAWPGILLLAALSTATGIFILSGFDSEAYQTRSGSVYILGPARTLLSNGLYERADFYFHKGAPRHKEEAFQSIFQKWKNEICPTEHAHTEGRETEEILPWLRLATQSDPHNLEVYLVASFWLNSDCERPDLAMEAIDEAIGKNPDRYELYLEKGRLFLAKDSYTEALVCLNHALEILVNTTQPDPEQANLDHPFIGMARSYLYEALSNQQGAIDATEDLLRFKSNVHFEERLIKLKQGILDPDSAKDRLHHLFYKEHECDQDDHDHDHSAEHMHD